MELGKEAKPDTKPPASPSKGERRLGSCLHNFQYFFFFLCGLTFKMLLVVQYEKNNRKINKQNEAT